MCSWLFVSVIPNYKKDLQQIVNSLSPGDAYVFHLTETLFSGLGNVLLPVWCQAITWTHGDLLSTGHLEIVGHFFQASICKVDPMWCCV